MRVSRLGGYFYFGPGFFAHWQKKCQWDPEKMPAQPFLGQGTACLSGEPKKRLQRGVLTFSGHGKYSVHTPTHTH